MSSKRRFLAPGLAVALSLGLFVALLSIIIAAAPVAAGRMQAAQAAGDTAEVQLTPRLLIDIQPQLQQFQPGNKATFQVVITNTGQVSFSKIAVTADEVPSCGRGQIGPLGIGQSLNYSCESGTLTEGFLLTLQATGQTSNAGSANATATAFVNVLSPELRIIKRPTTQVVRPGATARFSIVIFNTSNTLTLTEIKVADTGVPGCNLDPADPITLAPGESRDYSCSRENVQAPFVGVSTVTGRDAAGDTIYSAGDAAWVELLDLSATLTSNPTSVPEPGEVVEFTVQLSNPGSIYVKLTALTTNRYGNLLDPGNELVDSVTNSCLPKPSLPSIAPNGVFTCTFLAPVSGQPSPFNIILTATAQDPDSHVVTATANTTVTITDEQAAISLNVSADPNIVQSPGQVVDYEVRIQNESKADAVTIEELTDSILGNLDGRGTCNVPTAVIPVGGSYVCTFSANVSGPAGSSVKRTVTASGFDDDPAPHNVTANDMIEVPITNRPVQQIFMPNITDDVVEPNNRCSQAYPLSLNRQYQFEVDDSVDLYKFTLPRSGKVRIELTNFVLLDNQIIVYKDSCPTGEVIAYDPDNALNKFIDLGTQPASTYWIYMVNPKPTQTYPPYGLIVKFN